MTTTTLVITWYDLALATDKNFNSKRSNEFCKFFELRIFLEHVQLIVLNSGHFNAIGYWNSKYNLWIKMGIAKMGHLLTEKQDLFKLNCPFYCENWALNY